MKIILSEDEIKKIIKNNIFSRISIPLPDIELIDVFISIESDTQKIEAEIIYEK